MFELSWGGNAYAAKRWLLVLSVTAALVPPLESRAQEIAYEGFAYGPRQSLTEMAGGTGWNGAWFGADDARPIVVELPGMTFPTLAAHGGKCLLDGNDTRLFRRLDTDRPAIATHVETGAHGKVFGRDGTTIWIAFLIANTSYPRQAHGGMHLMDGVTLGATYKKSQRVQLGRQNNGNHWKLVRTDQGGPAADSWDGTVVSDRTSRLLVYRFDFNAGPEEAWMWVDPRPGTAPTAATADVHAPRIADFRFNAVNIGSGGGATFDFDELRIGTTFESVAPMWRASNRESRAVTSATAKRAGWLPGPARGAIVQPCRFLGFLVSVGRCHDGRRSAEPL